MKRCLVLQPKEQDDPRTLYLRIRRIHQLKDIPQGFSFFSSNSLQTGKKIPLVPSFHGYFFARFG